MRNFEMKDKYQIRRTDTIACIAIREELKIHYRFPKIVAGIRYLIPRAVT